MARFTLRNGVSAALLVVFATGASPLMAVDASPGSTANHSASPTTTPAPVPYHWRNVAIGGGGFVTGLVMHPAERALAYARTDVGGAYRWDNRAGAWVPLLDWIGRPDWNWQGVESLAVDPTDPQRLYLAVGTYTFPDASRGLILRSADQGRTWARTPLPFKFGANEAGRGSGERLAVDPHCSRILYLGTRRDGLWRSRDQGVSWSAVPGFPNLPDDSELHRPRPGQPFDYLQQAVGIICVQFDPQHGQPGEPTPLIYAAVSRAAGPVYRSEDAGTTWALVAGQPTGLRATGLSLATDGTLYVSYGDEPGPNGMKAGAVWKWDGASHAWTDITPERPAPPGAPGSHFGYAAVGVDPHDPATVITSTWNRWEPREELFRSTDAGRTWHPMLARSSWDHSTALYTSSMTPHWISDVEIDPFDPDHVRFTTGYGIWATNNASASDRGEATHWTFDNQGLEETVPLTLISPTKGAHLISGLGDVDGFRHDDLAKSPTERFPGPRFKSTESLDYAALAPARMVRSGLTYKMDRIHGAWSDDGAATWHAFATLPPLPVESSPYPTGPVAISADGMTLFWTTHGNRPYRTTDHGASWQIMNGAPVDMVVVADRVNATLIYGYDHNAGDLYVSTDAGRSFSKGDRALLGVPRRPWGGPLEAELRAVPDHEGELWFTALGRLFHGTNRGAEWREHAEMHRVSSVGFGKAAPGAAYPAVFVAAAFGTDDGLFRSDDAGVTWVRISDDSHRFGSARALTGDPRVFGRVYFATGGRGIIYGDPAH